MSASCVSVWVRFLSRRLLELGISIVTEGARTSLGFVSVVLPDEFVALSQDNGCRLSTVLVQRYCREELSTSAGLSLPASHARFHTPTFATMAMCTVCSKIVPHTRQLALYHNIGSLRTSVQTCPLYRMILTRFEESNLVVDAENYSALRDGVVHDVNDTAITVSINGHYAAADQNVHELIFSCRPLHRHGTFSRAVIHTAPWTVEDYTTRKATFDADKLTALEGLAQSIAALTRDRYSFGLWAASLDTGLLWRMAPYLDSAERQGTVPGRAPN